MNPSVVYSIVSTVSTRLLNTVSLLHLLPSLLFLFHWQQVLSQYILWHQQSLFCFICCVSFQCAFLSKISPLKAHLVLLVASPSTSHSITSAVSIVATYSIRSLASLSAACTSYYSSHNSTFGSINHQPCLQQILWHQLQKLIQWIQEQALLQLHKIRVPVLSLLQLTQHYFPCVLNTLSLPLLFGTTSTLYIFPDRNSQQFHAFHSTTAWSVLP